MHWSSKWIISVLNSLDRKVKKTTLVLTISSHFIFILSSATAMYRMPRWIFRFVEEFWIQPFPNSQGCTLSINTCLKEDAIILWQRCFSKYFLNNWTFFVAGVATLSSSYPQACKVSPFSCVYGCSLTALCTPILLPGCAQYSHSSLLHKLPGHFRKDTGWSMSHKTVDHHILPRHGLCRQIAHTLDFPCNKIIYTLPLRMD